MFAYIKDSLCLSALYYENEKIITNFALIQLFLTS